MRPQTFAGELTGTRCNVATPSDAFITSFFQHTVSVCEIVYDELMAGNYFSDLPSLEKNAYATVTHLIAIIKNQTDLQRVNEELHTLSDVLCHRGSLLATSVKHVCCR